MLLKSRSRPLSQVGLRLVEQGVSYSVKPVLVRQASHTIQFLADAHPVDPATVVDGHGRQLQAEVGGKKTWPFTHAIFTMSKTI